MQKYNTVKAIGVSFCVFETGKVRDEQQVHEGSVTDMRFSPDMTHFITASNDKTARLIDARTLEVLKVYKAGSPVNAVDMSATHDYVTQIHQCSAKKCV